VQGPKVSGGKEGYKPLKREAKEQIVSHLSHKLKQAQFAVLTDYRGLNVQKITQLRNELRRVSSEYRVAKNTFLKRASQGTEFEQLASYFEGPTAIMLSYDDPIAPSKVLTKFLGTYSKLSIKAGMLKGKLISAEEVKELSRLPGRQELLGKCVSLFTQPPLRFLNALRYPLFKLLQVLHAIEKSKLNK
jgi:large subunit ribosomal protein L10